MLQNQLELFEPNESNIRTWLETVSNKLRPIEQVRWSESHTDACFYAGVQQYNNNLFSGNNLSASRNFYFNICEKPVNMVTGYQRQHRKTATYQATGSGDPQTTDQYTKIIMEQCQNNGVYEDFSKSCEFSAISGLNLIQPYLDFLGEDPLQGELKIKVWEYNSFMVDPYFRKPDMSDANIIWCQEYIDKKEAKFRFPNQKDDISSMSNSLGSNTNFYFLPENTAANRNNLLVLSYIWYRSTREKKRFFSQKRQQFFDVADDMQAIQELLETVEDIEEVTVEVPTWKVCVVLNDRLMFKGNNPLKIDSAPCIPNFWNYDPHLNNYSARNRSLIRTTRDPQFLFNFKVITNNDIASATLNAGYKRKEGAVANEDNLRRVDQGYDLIIRSGYELTDVEKIVPTSVPQSDLELSKQMEDLIYSTSGINMENWSGQNDKMISSLTMMLKSAANLMVFQKYFDQWDMSFKLLSRTLLEIVLNNWNAFKVEQILGEEPSPLFYSRIFSQYRTVVQEGILTSTQQNMQAQQLLDINLAYGREVFPPSYVIDKMNIQGKAEAMEFLQQQEQMAQAQQQHQQGVQDAYEDAKIKELYSKATSNLAMARERHGRTESNIGLFEERLSEIVHNRALATKAKMESLEKLVDVIAKYGEIESALALNTVDEVNQQAVFQEDREKVDAKQTSLANDFQNSIMTLNNQSEDLQEF